MHENTGIGQGCSKLFFAYLKSYGEPEKKEGIRSIILKSIDEIEYMIVSDEFKDSYGLCALMKAKISKLI